MESEKYINVQDQDCHWYYIPASKEDEFYKDEAEGESDYYVSFMDKWNKYRTGGGPKED